MAKLLFEISDKNDQHTRKLLFLLQVTWPDFNQWWLSVAADDIMTAVSYYYLLHFPHIDVHNYQQTKQRYHSTLNMLYMGAA